MRLVIIILTPAAFAVLLFVGGCPGTANVQPGAVPVVVQPPVVTIYATMPAISLPAIPPGAVSIVFPPGSIVVNVQIGGKDMPLVANTANITVSPHLLGATAPATQRSEK